MRTFALLFTVAAAACGGSRLVRAHPAEGNLQVSGNEITCNGKRYATLKTFFCDPPDWCRAVAVVYEDSGHVAWLWRGAGFDDAIARGAYYNSSTVEEKGLGGAKGLKLSPDGRTVRFSAVFSTYVYDVQEGVLRTE